MPNISKQNKEAMRAGLDMAREALADKYKTQLHGLLIFHAGESCAFALTGNADKEKLHDDFAQVILDMQLDFGLRE